MIRTAFSTIACPNRTLDSVITLAAELGYQGLELRTFGHESADFAPDPALSGAAKVRDLFEDAGVDPCSIATSIHYSQPVFPPVIGRVFGDFEAPVRETKRMVELAASLECPFVRVFGFELQPGERIQSGMRRIRQRLSLALTTARHTGVRLMIENGGSFPTAQSLVEMLDDLNSPLLAAAYSPAVAHLAGEDPAEGVAMLGDRLAALKLRDHQDGTPVPIGAGDVPNEAAVRAAHAMTGEVWAIHEWDHLWLNDEIEAAEHPEEALAATAKMLYSWMGGNQSEIERRKFANA